MQPPTPASRHRAASQLVVMAGVLAVLFGSIVTPGYAATSGKTITIGESNDQAQRDELLGYFGATGDDEVEIITVAQTQKAMEKVIPNYSVPGAYSSTALTCRELGEGVDVTTINIYQITPAMYAMALVTAGVGDGDLIVAAPAAASAAGMTALAGIFQSWQSNPCTASTTTRARQELALRQIALTVEIGSVIGDQTVRAGDFVIGVQRNVVIDEATSTKAITEIVADQEALYFALPEEQRAKLVTLMVDLQELEIDWSTFSAGWTIEFNESGTGIVMRGDGIAIANAQASATAQAAKEDRATARAGKAATQTAEAVAEQTATAGARQTAEADAEQTAVAAEETARAGETIADQTRTANDGLTATARAQPTATPASTPEPVTASGRITAVTAPNLSVDIGGLPTDYRVMDAATISRDGETVALLDLESGDAVGLQVVPGTNQVVGIVATAPDTASPLAALSKLLLALPLLALIPVGIVLRGRSFGDPFIVKRVSH